MTSVFERYFVSICVLFASLALLWAEAQIGFYIALAAGLASSFLFFVSARNHMSAYYPFAKWFLYFQIAAYFTTVSCRIGILGILMGFVAFMIAYYVLKLIEVPKDKID